MILQRAIERESVSQVLRTLITRMDGYPDRTRAPTVRLSGTNVIEFGGGSEPGEADATWEAFLTLAEAGIVSIKMPRPKSGYAPYELEPVVQLVPAAAERARELLGMMKPGESRAKLWAEAARSVSGSTRSKSRRMSDSSLFLFMVSFSLSVFKLSCRGGRGA